MKSRSRQIVDKSIDAIIASIEVYNKPSFSYREESFSIFVINAWELLLKARILQIDGNKVSAILMYEKRQKADGTLSEKLYRKKNRTGNYQSIGLFKAHDLLVNSYGDTIDSVVLKNLELLTEIRDNAIHFINKDFDLKKKIHELGTACLKNYLHYIRQWFAVDLSEYHLFLMPIAFLHNISSAKGINTNSAEKNVLSYVTSIEGEVDDDIANDCNLTLNIDVKVSKTSSNRAQKVRISNDPDAVKVRLSEETVREQFPWDFRILTNRLKVRYSDFKENNTYHALRKPLEKNPKLCSPRFLDPGNPKSSKKNFYNSNILKEFDKHYKRANKSSKGTLESGAPS